MIIPVVCLGLALTWMFSAVMLTVGLYFLRQIMGWRTEAGFWAPFPLALLVSAILTFVDWGLKLFPIPFLGGIASIIIWFIVIMKVFDVEFFEALVLAVVLFIMKIVFMIFVLGFIFSAIG